MGKRHRQRRSGRRPPFRDPKPVILVVTEGAVTEPEYLEGFKNAFRNRRVHVKIEEGAGAPLTIVAVAKTMKKDAEKRAKRENDDNLRYDEVWCAFDVDEHQSVDDARQTARDSDISLAVSNPCIELWLYLHFAEQPGMQDRRQMLRRLKRHVSSYDKHVDFVDYAHGYDDATRRAARLDEDAEMDNEGGRNPTTGFWRLTESIRAGA